MSNDESGRPRPPSPAFVGAGSSLPPRTGEGISLPLGRGRVREGASPIQVTQGPAREEARRLCYRRASCIPPRVVASGPLTPACPVYPTGGAQVTAECPCPPSAGPTAPLAASPALPSSRLDSSILHRPGRRGDQKGSAIYGSIRTLEPFQPPSASFTTIVPPNATVCKRFGRANITISCRQPGPGCRRAAGTTTSTS